VNSVVAFFGFIERFENCVPINSSHSLSQSALDYTTAFSVLLVAGLVLVLKFNSMMLWSLSIFIRHYFAVYLFIPEFLALWYRCWIRCLCIPQYQWFSGLIWHLESEIFSDISSKFLLWLKKNTGSISRLHLHSILCCIARRRILLSWTYDPLSLYWQYWLMRFSVWLDLNRDQVRINYLAHFCDNQVSIEYYDCCHWVFVMQDTSVCYRHQFPISYCRLLNTCYVHFAFCNILLVLTSLLNFFLHWSGLFKYSILL